MTASYLQADVANVLADIDGLLSAYPELADDADLRTDMLEGSTDAFSVLSRCLNQEREAESLSRAIASRISDLQGRKARAERKKEAMRVLMLRIMRAADIRKASLVEATVSVSKGRDSVEIIDEATLPEWAYETTRKPLKKEIMVKLAANENVPGAMLKTGEDTVTVRVA